MTAHLVRTTRNDDSETEGTALVVDSKGNEIGVHWERTLGVVGVWRGDDNLSLFFDKDEVEQIERDLTIAVVGDELSDVEHERAVQADEIITFVRERAALSPDDADFLAALLDAYDRMTACRSRLRDETLMAVIEGSRE